MKSDLKKQEEFYLFCLSRIKGLGSNSICSLIKEYSSCENIWQKCSMDNPDKLLKLIHRSQRDKKFISEAKSAWSDFDELHISLIDKNYPGLLKNIYDPPLFLFYRGNINLLNNKHVLTIVGSRQMTEYHQTSLSKIMTGFKNSHLTIVSGLAYGIDALSHKLALENNLPTIAVLGSGLNDSVLYPTENLHLAKQILNNNGLLLSEYPALTEPLPHQFAKRNRILAGLSKTTIVISGALKSGTLITAQVAIDEGREVYALPGNINLKLCQGPNSLLANGAQIILSAEDILKNYNLKISKIPANKIKFKNEHHAKIYTILQTESLSLAELSQSLNMDLSKLSSIISQWEIQGLVKINKFNQVEIL